jgi:NADH-quinone oxidoreductase subunit N
MFSSFFESTNNLLTNFNPFYAESMHLFFSICILMVSILYKNYNMKKIIFINWLLIVNTLLTLLVFLFSNNYKAIWNSTVIINNGLFVQDNFTLSIKVFILSIFLLLLIFSHNYWTQSINLSSEVPIFMSLSTSGILLFVSSNHFIVFTSLFIYLSLITSTLINGSNYSKFSAEGSIKNYIISGVASVFLVFSIFLIHYSTGVETFTDLFNISLQFGRWDPNEVPTTFILAVCLFFIVLFIKLGAAPFHQVLVDAYESAPLPVAAFLLAILKFAYFSIFIKLWLGLMHTDLFTWAEYLGYVGFASLIFGVFPAFSQIKIRRLLNYSTVANLGFVLVIFDYSNILGSAWLGLVFMSVYSVTIISIFGILLTTRLISPKRDLTYLTDLTLLGKYKPFLGVLLCILIFSLAGLPPFLGFAAKFTVLYSYISTYLKADHILLLLSLSVLPIFYYIRLCKIIFMDNITNNGLQINKAENTTIYYSILSLMFIIVCTLIPGFSVIQVIGLFWESSVLCDWVSTVNTSF